MADHECPFETQLLDTLHRSGWAGADAGLQAHAGTCDRCAALLAVAVPLLEEGREAVGEARVPPAAAMWWRLRLRARREASEAAARPISAFQWLALAGGVGLLTSAVGIVSPTVRAFGAWLWRAGLAAAGVPMHVTGSDVPMLGALGLVAVSAALLVALVAPVAVYLTGKD